MLLEIPQCIKITIKHLQKSKVYVEKRYGSPAGS